MRDLRSSVISTNDRLADLIDQTQKAMARNLADELYGDNALGNVLGRDIPRQSIMERAKSRLGGFFLKIANGLGVYNDDY